MNQPLSTQETTPFHQMMSHVHFIPVQRPQSQWWRKRWWKRVRLKQSSTVPATPQPAHRFPLASNGRLLDIAEVHPLVVTSTPKRPAPDGTPKTPAPDGTPKIPAPDGTPKTPAPDGTPKIRAQSSPRPRKKEATMTVVKITEKGIVAFSLFCYSHILFKIYI